MALAYNNVSEMCRLLEGMNLVNDYKSMSDLIGKISSPSGPTVVSFINHHAFNIAWSNWNARNHLKASDFLLRDGIGMELMFRSLRRDPGMNCNGTDLIPEILKYSKGRSIALFGTSDHWLSIAKKNTELSGHVVCSTLHGFAADSEYLEVLFKSKPGIIILGMGMPRQEALSHLIKSHIDWPCLIINGGAIIDFIAGRFVRAPKVVRSVRLEWLFRLMMEPRRLFRRYVVGGMLFIGRAFLIMSALKASNKRSVSIKIL
ncbi:WecB/TagA/CpsF family glycosyltransferase [Methylobacterium sp. CM6247]